MIILGGGKIENLSTRDQHIVNTIMANPGLSNANAFRKAGVSQKVGVDCLKSQRLRWR